MLNILPKKNYEIQNCLDDIVVTVANWFNRGYELMYSGSWSFLYKPAKTHVAPLGNSIDIIPTDKYILLEKYHGIKLNFQKNKSLDDTLTIIGNELSKNRPVAIYINAFWCPTCFAYQIQKTEQNHFCLVVGVDMSKRILKYVDPFFMKSNIELTIDDLTQGYRNQIITFSLINPEISEVNWKIIISKIIDRLKNTFEELNIFDMIRKFSYHLRYSLDMKKEKVVPDMNVGDFPLIRKLISITNSRKEFCFLLDYMTKKYNVPYLIEFSSRIKDVTLKWGMVRALLCKSYLASNFSTVLKNKIADIVLDIADYEENIANDLIRNQNLKPGFSVIESSNKDYTTELNNIYFVDLKPHFNSKSFSRLHKYNGKADFTGDGRFFITDYFDYSSWKYKSMFDMIYITKDLDDNILCAGNIIDLPKQRFKAIMILASSDFDHMIDKLRILYSDGYEEEVEVKFSFFRADKPFFNEIIAFSGKFGQFINGKIKELPYFGNLYYKRFKLKHDGIISSICLPYCPNMHIYAISMGK